MTDTDNGKTPALSESQVQSLMGHMKKHENPQKIKHPYFDTKGHLTVGPGFKIESAEELASLNLTITNSKGETVPPEDAFKIFGEHAPKTPADKNRPAGKYKDMGGLTAVISEETVNRRLREEITQRADRARKVLGEDNWKKLPAGVQDTIVDIAYTNGGVEKWEGLQKAVKDYEPGTAEGLEAVAKETFWHTGVRDGEKQRPEDRFHDNLKKIFGGDEERAKKFYQDYHPDKPQSAGEQKPADTPEAPPQSLLGEGGDGETNSAWGEKSLVAREKAPADKTQSPDAARIQKLLARAAGDRFDSLEDLLLLRPDQITQAQAHDLTRAYLDLPSDDPKRDEFARQKTAFFDHAYGPEPQRKDFTGRPVDDGPKNPPPKNASRPRDGRGADIGEAVKQAAGTVAHYAAGTGLAPAVEALQAGLNLMERARLVKDKAEAEKQRKSGEIVKPETPFTFQALLKEDGNFGPKTHAQLKRTAARDGAGALKNALALGGFRAAAHSADAARGLVDAHMGALFPARSQEPKRKPQVMALQSALNAMRPAGTEDLKEDGDFGPKTAAVFTETVKKRRPDDLTERFGRELGFIN